MAAGNLVAVFWFNQVTEDRARALCPLTQPPTARSIISPAFEEPQPCVPCCLLPPPRRRSRRLEGGGRASSVSRVIVKKPAGGGS